MTGLTGSNISVSLTDKRRTGAQARQNSHLVSRKTMFTANAAGTATTLVGADATLGTGANVVRIGDKFKLFASAAAATASTPKEDTVFTVTNVASATGTTTVTFSPAAAAATANGNVARLVSLDDLMDEANLDAALTALDGVTYSAAKLLSMTQNDKIYAYMLLTNRDSI